MVLTLLRKECWEDVGESVGVDMNTKRRCPTKGTSRGWEFSVLLWFLWGFKGRKTDEDTWPVLESSERSF